MENSTELTSFLKEKFAAIHGDNSFNSLNVNETVTTTTTKTTKLDYNANELNGFGIMNGNNNSNSSDDDSHDLAKSTSTDADQPMVDTNNNSVTLLEEEEVQTNQNTFNTKEIHQNIVSNSAILEAKSNQSAKIKLENSSMKTTVEIHNNNNNDDNDNVVQIELAKNELMNELKRQLSTRSEKSSIKQDIKSNGESVESEDNHLKQPDLAALNIDEDNDYRVDNGGHNDGDNQRENVDHHNNNDKLEACISSKQSITNSKDNAGNSLDNDDIAEVIAAININNDSNHNGGEQSLLGNKTQDNNDDDNVQSSVTAEPELTIPSIENSTTKTTNSTNIDSDPPKPSPRTTNQLNHNSEPITTSAATLPRSHKQLDRSISAFQTSVRLRNQNKPEQFSRSISNRDVAFTLEASKEEPKITRSRVSRMSQLWKDRIITAKDDSK